MRTYFGIYIGVSLFWETTSFQELPGRSMQSESLGSLVLPKDLLTSKAYIKIGGVCCGGTMQGELGILQVCSRHCAGTAWKTWRRKPFTVSFSHGPTEWHDEIYREHKDPLRVLLLLL